jgi:hypothetical protein
MHTSIASFLRRLLSPRPSKPQQAPAYPLGLSQDQVDSLRQLRSIPQWRSYSEALQAVCESDMARLLSGLPHDQYLLTCGRIQSRMESLTLLDTLDQKAREIDEHSRPAPEPTFRDLPFVGSVWWDAHRKRAPIHGPVGNGNSGNG